MLAKILIDNQSKNELACEWGLAVYLEYEGHKLLLDTGTTGAFVKNAKSMGVDLEEVEYGILSHAHYDHSDGMTSFFEKNSKAKFYLRRGAGENCYGRRWIFYKYIGIARGVLDSYRDRIVYVDGRFGLFPGVYLLPHTTPGLEQIGKRAGLYVKQGKRRVPDSFVHEQSLIFDTKEGLVIFNSCSHGGADNIIREVSEAFPGKSICALVGGLHLYRSAEEEVRTLARRVLETGIKRVITGHCTGERAFRLLKEELGDVVQGLYTGMEFTIG
ncbi:MAG: MBL fold metallo-hydrolase [Lachnospiraceae bacterium]|jgi:7,8-dihydropterin-6-yl-methyl-4-(beta-D-ribofuranosyl)aminobenzene 5'-phosphate synthase|nr:MBL fold metallo-hydrolase [Lachnospiraceae bacterium]